MRMITATELARNLRQVLDNLLANGEEIVVERNHRQIARILPGPGTQTALEAMADLYRTLPDSAAAGWQAAGRQMEEQGANVADGVRNPWDS